MPFGGSAALGIMSGKKPYLSVSSELVLCRQRQLQEQEDSTGESDLVSALPEALQFEVASEDDILENEANIPVRENIASTAEGILEDIMTGIVQGAPLDDKQEVEEEEVDMIYLLTAIGLSPRGRNTVHIYTQTIHRMIQNKQYIEQHNNWKSAGHAPSWLVIPWHLAYNRGKSTEKPQGSRV
jgi:hypothetical protein